MSLYDTILCWQAFRIHYTQLEKCRSCCTATDCCITRVKLSSKRVSTRSPTSVADSIVHYLTPLTPGIVRPHLIRKTGCTYVSLVSASNLDLSTWQPGHDRLPMHLKNVFRYSALSLPATTSRWSSWWSEGSVASMRGRWTP